MTNSLESITYTIIRGQKESLRATVYALSTCAFCKRGMEYLERHGIGYRYVQLDKLDFEAKRQVKQELKDRYEDLPMFPILTVGDDVALSGFEKKRWAEVLGITSDEQE